MSDKGLLGVSPYNKVMLAIEVNAATDTPLPVHFTNDQTSGLFQPVTGAAALAGGAVEGVRCTANGVQVMKATALPAGGALTSGMTFSSAAVSAGSGASVPGLYWGSGAPTFTAGQGSLYIRTDGTSTSSRLYVATPNTWTGVTTAV